MPTADPPEADRSDNEVPEVAGYRLLRRIGEGSMSSVYVSYDVAAGAPVAVKLLADHLAHSREFVNRFYREARLCRLLSHPNLVRGQAAGFDPATGKHYLVLELIDGPSAQAALATHGRFSIGAAVQVGIDIARALEFLHSRHYVHRDVKPDNVLLHPSGTAKLADLGLTKRLNDDPHLTSVAQGVGTSYYMAYEQALNPNLVDGRSDIFSLGATLYHLLAGEVPFPGATHEEVIREKERNVFRPIRTINPLVPVELAKVISAMLARDPRARLQSATEVIERLEATGLATTIPAIGLNDSESGPGSDAPTRADLKPFQRTETAPPAPQQTRDATFAALPATDADARPTAPPPIPRTRKILGWLVGLVVAVSVTATVFGMRSRDPGASPHSQPKAGAGKVSRSLRVLPEPPSIGSLFPALPQ